MRDRPRVGISSCLLGERVRYNGGDKRDPWLVDVLGRDVEWVPVCPEVEAGFGTPREPMTLARDPGATAGEGGEPGVVLMTGEPRRDLTDRLRRYASRRVEELAALDLDGYVLKAGSPSCAIETAIDAGPLPAGRGPGLFAEAVMRRLPDLPLADELQLADPATRQRFVARVFARCRGGQVTR